MLYKTIKLLIILFIAGDLVGMNIPQNSTPIKKVFSRYIGTMARTCAKELLFSSSDNIYKLSPDMQPQEIYFDFMRGIITALNGLSDLHKILLGTSDGILLYDLTNREISLITQHDNSIKAICVAQNNILSVDNLNPIIKVSDIYKQDKAILQGHTSFINTLVNFDENSFISGSDDETIKLWDLRSLQCVKTLSTSTPTKTQHLSLVDHNTGQILVQSTTWKPLLIGKNQHAILSVCRFDNNKIISGSHDKSVKIWDIRTDHCEKTFEEPAPVKVVAVVDDNHFIAASGYLAKIWNKDNNQPVQTLEVQQHTTMHPEFNTIINSIDTYNDNILIAHQSGIDLFKFEKN